MHLCKHDVTLTGFVPWLNSKLCPWVLRRWRPSEVSSGSQHFSRGLEHIPTRQALFKNSPRPSTATPPPTSQLSPPGCYEPTCPFNSPPTRLQWFMFWMSWPKVWHVPWAKWVRTSYSLSPHCTPAPSIVLPSTPPPPPTPIYDSRAR